MSIQYPGVKTRRFENGQRQSILRAQIGGEHDIDNVIIRAGSATGSAIQAGRIVVNNKSEDSVSNSRVSNEKVMIPDEVGDHTYFKRIVNGQRITTKYSEVNPATGNPYIDESKDYNGGFFGLGVSISHGCKTDCQREYEDCPLPPIGSVDEITKENYVMPADPNRHAGGVVEYVDEGRVYVECVTDIPERTLASDIYVVTKNVVTYDPSAPLTASKYGAISTDSAHGVKLSELNPKWANSYIFAAGVQGGAAGLHL